MAKLPNPPVPKHLRPKPPPGPPLLKQPLKTFRLKTANGEVIEVQATTFFGAAAQISDPDIWRVGNVELVGLAEPR